MSDFVFDRGNDVASQTPRKARATLGSDDADAAKAVGQMGAEHQACEVSDIVVDDKHRLVTTPAYMLAQSISEAASGIYKLVDRVLEMTTES